MSYALTVEVQGGVARVVAASALPDDVYNITGHIDDGYEHITTGRRTLDGKPVIVASGTVYKEV